MTTSIPVVHQVNLSDDAFALTACAIGAWMAVEGVRGGVAPTVLTEREGAVLYTMFTRAIEQRFGNIKVPNDRYLAAFVEMTNQFKSREGPRG